MTEFFTEKYALVWAAILAVALYFPARQLIWTMSVRRAERDGSQDQARRQSLKRRAGATAALLALVFAYIYTKVMFKA